MRRARFTIDGCGLEFDRDYGHDRRTGWSCVWRGVVVVQFVTGARALRTLLWCWRRNRDHRLDALADSAATGMGEE